MAQINFIRFSAAPELGGFEGGSGSVLTPTEDFYAMPMQPGDLIRFLYAPELGDFEVTELKVGILSGDELVAGAEDIAVFSNGSYWQMTIPVELPPGCYRFLIYDQTFNATEWVQTDAVCVTNEDMQNTGQQDVTETREVDDTPTNTALLISNPFQYRFGIESKIIEFRGNQNGWGGDVPFDYETDTSFYQRFRIEITLSQPRYPEIKKVYRQSNGFYRHSNVLQDKKVTLQTEYFDEATHDAMAAAIKHDNFFIDGLSYFSSEEYEPDWIETGNTANRYYELSTAATDLYLQGYNQRNNTCGGNPGVVDLPLQLIETSQGTGLGIG